MKKKHSKNYVDSKGEVSELDDEWFRTAVLIEPKAPRKSISFRVDPKLLEWFKAEGPGYQSRMHAVLEAYARAHRPAKG